jgi:PadR family transcriptional regulator PadR
MKSKFKKELSAGTFSLVILAMMEKAAEPMYGYQIAKALGNSNSGEDPAIKKGTIYPVLRSLEKSELLASEVEPSISGPPRKYYTITARGREELIEWKKIWNKTRNFVDSILAEKNAINAEKGS